MWSLYKLLINCWLLTGNSIKIRHIELMYCKRKQLSPGKKWKLPDIIGEAFKSMEEAKFSNWSQWRWTAPSPHPATPPALPDDVWRHADGAVPHLPGDVPREGRWEQRLHHRHHVLRLGPRHAAAVHVRREVKKGCPKCRVAVGSIAASRSNYSREIEMASGNADPSLTHDVNFGSVKPLSKMNKYLT